MPLTPLIALLLAVIAAAAVTVWLLSAASVLAPAATLPALLIFALVARRYLG